jgi:predicted HNH restriction endonuclease
MMKWRQKKKLLEHLGQTGCQICGISDIRVLTFHHIDPKDKKFGIGNKLTSPIEQLKTEADKCKVLCANCHLIEHSPYYEMEKEWKESMVV